MFPTVKCWFCTLLFLLAVLSGAVLLGYADLRAFADRPLLLPEDQQTVTLGPGEAPRQLFHRLEERGLLDRPARYLELLARLDGSSLNLRAGEYRLEKGATPNTLLAILMSGQVVQYSVTIVEGWTADQMLAAVRRLEWIDPVLDGLEWPEIMARLGQPEEHPEGRFLPDTYMFPRGVSDLDVLRRAMASMTRVLEAEWEGRSEGLPLDSAYEALILASIVEKETAVPAERGEVAGVFVRRLEKEMKLQTDPTVIYGMGEAFDGNIRRKDLRSDTPYNTYTRFGLPPTPIALPGRAAIHASLHPDPGETLYFVSRGDGTHHFSVTYEEHERAVRKYQLGQ